VVAAGVVLVEVDDDDVIRGWIRDSVGQRRPRRKRGGKGIVKG
jgi:hypothetical protein